VSGRTAARAHYASARILTLILLVGFFAFSCSPGNSPTAPDSQTTGAAGGTLGSNIVVSDGSHIDIEKSTNGEDADEPIGPQIPVGDPVTWTYLVMNNGSLPLIGIVVTDDQLGVIECPHTTLAAGHMMTCTATGVAQEGQYRNVARATGTTSQGVDAVDEDPSHYFGVVPGVAAIDLEKATNGEDADEETGPEITVGEMVEWTYVVTNTGDVALEQIALSDDQLGDIECPTDELAPGESMTCTAEGEAVEGQYVNVGTVVATTAEGEETSDEDASHYLGVAFEETPAIDIEKLTNGSNADATPGPLVAVGDPVSWTYEVTNVGNVDLTAVAVTDDQIGAITCPQATLAVGESMICTADGFAIEGQYANLGTATGTGPDGTVVDDTDASHYFGLAESEEVLSCGQGYWKNHLADWAGTPYSPSDLIGDVFASANAWPAIGGSTLLEGLGFPGGPGVDGAIRIVMRHAIAGLLNATHPDFAAPYTANEIIDMMNAAIDSNDRQTILKLNGAFFTESGSCSLN